ncbi:hypothetical protein GBP07_00770 [Pediococcus acidilactici]|uniref:hypothetical protein n=1 Tax=Pediococcus acidilactici TaxID=1254 RepID=UPI000E5C6FB7|nr:hypothetical protein [Pediococcus acidilactici]KAF0368963.1 hypothetical protein GBO52_01840 [Pediococcus acidilactici]KAF0465479.1 hypothetical protein GBP04_04985 [Pediococcus acidilactici]KAF0473709.1 hypothetical protein GBP07_00770 [Pediococcus acidilactici]KAF0490148.1 hypothetical protein GBP15_05325 [Pediococcus acidilactici]KAF0516875.1 hypothetical protein GBP29_05760 [Pediococcus acidilactici]
MDKQKTQQTNTKATNEFKQNMLKVQDELNEGLKKGQHYAELMQVLTTTTDPEELLSATRQLANFEVDTAAVVFPKKFAASDYYLIFMSRLLELNGLTNQFRSVMTEAGGHPVMHHQWPGTEQTFRFEKNGEHLAYVEQTSHQIIFRLDIEKQTMSFDTETINNLYFLSGSETDPQSALKKQVASFIKFGQLLEKDYNFQVDFNMFDARNEKTYVFEGTGLDSSILDELFVSAAQNHYILYNADEFLGAFLRLKSNVMLTIFEMSASDHQWAMRVQDQEEQYSLFDVLKDYAFLNDWYVNNIGDLKLKMIL